jgi:hypothetical protein
LFHKFQKVYFCHVTLDGLFRKVALRIKSVGKQILHIFKSKQQANPGWVIPPDKTINERDIRDNCSDLLRLVVTIKLKENTAPEIYRRLFECIDGFYNSRRQHSALAGKSPLDFEK